MSENWNILIEAYLDDSLSNTQKEAFDLALNNEAFREQLLFKAKMLDSFEALQKKKLIKDIKNYKPDKTIQPGIIASYWPMKIAAALVFIIAALFLIKLGQANPTQELYKKYYRSYPVVITERSHSGHPDDPYKRAMEAYVDESYSEAIESFKLTFPKDDFIQLYMAICYLETGAFDASKAVLTELLLSSNTKIIQNAEWYLAMVYLKSNKSQRVIDLLNPISHNGDHLFNREAKAILLSLMK